MRVLEILLPKSANSRDLSPKAVQKIDALQQRMNSYVDKIMNPNTSVQGKEFLKSRLRDDYYELKSHIKHIDLVAEADNMLPEPQASKQYEVYDRQTGARAGGPYSTSSRARAARDKLDNKYGGYRYGCRPITKITEAVHRVPLSNNDFEVLKKLMEKPIPAGIAPIYINDLIDDDEFNQQLESLDSGLDVRPYIAEWIDRVMPDQKFRFLDKTNRPGEDAGQLSVIHGYDPHQYKGQSMEVTGNNAFGRT